LSEDLSPVEKKLYDLLKERKVVPIKELIELGLAGPLGKLVSRHLAKIERSFTEPIKDLRKKVVFLGE